jgi:mannose-1-phosphate guanylyltransferase
VRALLLAAGLGTRLRPLTNAVPKCLIPVNGRPLLDYWLQLLLGGGIELVLINTHYLAEKVRAFVEASDWANRIALVHEDTLLGTGGTVLRNRAYFGNRPFFVAHADNLTRFDVRAFMARHASRPPNVAITMMTFVTDAPRSCGVVTEDGAGVVRGFHEKVINPPSDIANAAVYIFEPEVLSFLESLGREVIDLSTEVLPRFLGRICTYRNAGYHRDIGSPDSLRQAEREYRPA